MDPLTIPSGEENATQAKLRKDLSKCIFCCDRYPSVEELFTWKSPRIPNATQTISKSEWNEFFVHVVTVILCPPTEFLDKLFASKDIFTWFSCCPECYKSGDQAVQISKQLQKLISSFESLKKKLIGKIKDSWAHQHSSGTTDEEKNDNFYQLRSYAFISRECI